MELWDAYYEDGTRANVDLIRGNEVPDGLYHVVCDVLVRHVDGDYLLMQRDYDKPSHAGEFEATAGGSRIKGETNLQCIERELREETGIKCQKFEPVGRAVYPESHCIMHSYVCKTDCDKNSITLQQGETIGYKWVSEEDFKKYVNSDYYSARRRERYRNHLQKMGYLK